MGQYDFSAQRVHHAATQLLSTSRLKHPPSWYNALFDVPPPQLLVRPAFKASGHVVEKRAQLPKRLRKGKRPSRMFQPLAIPRGLEHELRETFFTHHPWELARPRVVLENDGRDSEKWDWARGIKQPGKPLDGESVVQRQLYLRNARPPHAFASAHTRNQAERTVVIRNLARDTTVEDVRTYFAECGSIQHVDILRGREAALEPHTLAELVTEMEAGTESGSLEDLGLRTSHIKEEPQQSSPHQLPQGQDPIQPVEEFEETMSSEIAPMPTRDFEIRSDSIVTTVRFNTLEQAFAAIQKSGSSIKPSASPILVRRLPQPRHTLFLAGLPPHITENSLVQAFKQCGQISHHHVVHARTAPQEPTGFGFITLQDAAQAAAAKEKFVHHPNVRVYDFPLSHDLCYDLARKEFYKHRHYTDIERKVAQEEALSTGAYFTSSPNAIATPLEDQNYENWKAWAIQETEKAKQAQGSLITGLDNEDAVLAEGEVEEGVQDVADSVPATKEGQTALGGAAVHP